MFGQGLPLGPLDLLELIDFGAFAVIGAADALGEQLLEIGVQTWARGEKRRFRVNRESGM